MIGLSFHVSALICKQKEDLALIKKLSGVRPRLLVADPRGVDRYLYNLKLFKQSIALRFLRGLSNGIKNAGGNPPALGGRPFREDQLIYTTTQGVLSRHNYIRTNVLKYQVNA